MVIDVVISLIFLLIKKQKLPSPKVSDSFVDDASDQSVRSDLFKYEKKEHDIKYSDPIRSQKKLLTLQNSSLFFRFILEMKYQYAIAN